MQKLNPVAFLIIIVIGLFSCKKETHGPYRTITPLPYLPVYPGSTWTYLGLHNDTIHSSVYPSYQLNSYALASNTYAQTDPVYVPFWDGTPVYGYSKQYGGLQHQILSTTLGEVFNGMALYEGSNYDKVTSVDTSITVNSVVYNHVITITNFNNFPHYFLTYPKTYTYYALNIGMILRDSITGVPSVVHVRSILNYHINQ